MYLQEDFIKAIEEALAGNRAEAVLRSSNARARFEYPQWVPAPGRLPTELSSAPPPGI
jgi:hypothetical protein